MNGPGMTQGSITQPPLAESPPYDRRPQDQPYDQQPYGQQHGGQPPAQPQYDPQYGPPPAQTAARPDPGGPGPSGDEFDPNAHPGAPGAPRPLGAPLDMGAIANGRQTPSEPPPINDRTPQQQQMAVLPPSNSAKDEYDLAYGYILRRDYALAEQAFRVFLQSHPNDRLVSDASYWLGESQYQRQLYNDSAESFLNVYNKYPQSPKAPDALLRLGQSLAAIGKQDAACATLGEVVKKYPKASSQVKKQVGAEQKRIRC
jgi:tol-pal system protein YbgF